MSSDNADRAEGRPWLLAYAQLLRLPNVFTAIADVAMGFLFVHGTLQPIAGFILLLASSCLLYTAGMVLNDVHDFDVDLQERPTRPLPSGRISRGVARRLGNGMLVVGTLCGLAAGYVVTEPTGPQWRSGAIAAALACCVIGYDAVFKKTAAGPFLMGACRFFNVLLGMSLGASGELPLYFDSAHLLVAGGIGTYIVGVTWFARTEAKRSSRGLLVFGVGVMAVGVMMLAFFPQYTQAPRDYRIEPTVVWPLALFLLTVTILRRCLIAVADPTPREVQAAVKQCILSLIVLDAAVCLLVADWYWAVGVLALLVPTLILGKYVYST